MDLDLSTKYRTSTCCVKSCLISFAMTDEFYNKRLEDKMPFYCPNGHAQHFASETKEESLKKEIQRLNGKIESMRDCKHAIEYRRRYWKGEVTKLKKKGH